MALLIAGTLAAGCSIGWPRLHRRAAAASAGEPALGAAGARPVAGPSAHPSLARVPGARPPAVPPTTAHPSVAELENILTGLAAVRERAFAQRQPALLAAAYASPTLLAADTAQLLHGVPAGCRLAGLHTSYRDVRTLTSVGGTAGHAARSKSSAGTAVVDPSAVAADTTVRDGTRSVTVAAIATLSAGTLSCAGTVRGHSRPAAPVRLRLVLTDDGRGRRMASQRLG